MRVLLLVVALAALVYADGRAVVSVAIEDRPFYVGEPIPLELRIEIDSPFFRESGVQLFQTELPYPLHVSLPWWRKWRHGEVASPRMRDLGTVIGLNDDLTPALESARADAVRDLVLTRAGVLTVREAGTYKLAGPRLRYAFATKFREDFLGRRPLDRRDVVVEGEARTIEVRAIPTEGRPADFGGALGRFRVSATAERTDAGVEEPFTVVVRIEGEGNLTRFDTPAWNDLPGIHKLSSRDDRTDPVRTIRYEFYRTRADVEALPALSLSYFDPKRGEFATAATEPIRLSRLVGPSQPNPEEVAPQGVPWVWIALGGLLIGLVVWRSTKAKGPDEAERAVRAAAQSVADPARDPAETFVNYLARRLGVPQASVIARDLPRRLQAAGISDAVAYEAAALVEELVAQRYAGRASSDSHRHRARSVTAKLEQVWAR